MTKFNRVRSGQRIEIYADTWNAILGAAEANAISQTSGGNPGKRPEQLPANVVWVRNDSGSNQAAQNILGIDEPIILPSDNEAEFFRRPAVAGVTPDLETHRGRWVVLIEPIPIGKIGIGYIGGAIPVRLYENVAEGQSFADISTGDSTKLTTSKSGTARVLWLSGGDGYGIVQMGSPAASGEVWYGSIGGIDGETITVTSNGELVTVAKPNWLRNSYVHPAGTYTYGTYSNNYNNRLTTDALTSDVFEEQITPLYRVGDPIAFIRSVTGGTGVDDVVALDMNIDSRAWAVAGLVSS